MGRRNHHKNSASFFLGALFGSLTGGITALLFAPKTGSKMRKDLARSCHDVCEKAEDLVERAKDVAEDAKDTAKCVMKRIRKAK